VCSHYACIDLVDLALIDISILQGAMNNVVASLDPDCQRRGALVQKIDVKQGAPVRGKQQKAIRWIHASPAGSHWIDELVRDGVDDNGKYANL
jgi:hypothetical protein